MSYQKTGWVDTTITPHGPKKKPTSFHFRAGWLEAYIKLEKKGSRYEWMLHMEDIGLHKKLHLGVSVPAHLVKNRALVVVQTTLYDTLNKLPNLAKPLDGKVVTLSGRFGDRSLREMRYLLEDLGACVVHTVINADAMAKLDILVVGDNPGPKVQLAKEVGLEVQGVKFVDELASKMGFGI